MDDEATRPKPLTHQIGQNIDSLSLHELDERIALLRAEMARLDAARSGKASALAAAGSVFRIG